MRNRNIITNAGLVALALVSSALAAPIPISYLGLGNTVSVINRVQPILGGGSFNAQVGNPTLANSVNTLLWCVDLENHISPGDLLATYPANIILIPDTTANASLVRKGTTVTPAGWEDGENFNAQQRYNGAAYLVEKIIAGGTTAQLEDRQRAIWRLTDLAIGSDTGNNLIWENSEYTDALAFMAGGGTTARTWATISGIAPGGALSPSDTRQTFLVEVAPIPEPGTYALMGGGLLLLAGLRRRRRSN